MKLRNILALILFPVLIISCREQIYQINGTGIGTFYDVKYINNDRKITNYQIDSLLSVYNHEFSIFDPSSTLSKINDNISIPLSSDFCRLIQRSQEISKLTGGAFDVTVTPLVTYWGFGREEFHRIDSVVIDSLRALVGYEKIALCGNVLQKEDCRVSLNFNAIAKGYVVDKVGEFLESYGIRNFIVNIGGEVVTRGTKWGRPWLVGVEMPSEDDEDVQGIISTFPLQNRAIATSGNYRNYIEKEGERYTHIINPFTGFPEKSDLLSVSVIAADCMTADALATAFMVMNREEALKLLKENPHYDAFFIYTENGKLKTLKTENWVE